MSNRKRKGRDVSGWLCLDKRVGQTSTSAVAAVKRLLDAQKAGHAGEFGDLDHRELIVQSDAESVPTPASQHETAQPFLRDPNRGEQKREPEIIRGTQPRGSTRWRIEGHLGRGWRDLNKLAMGRGIFFMPSLSALRTVLT